MKGSEDELGMLEATDALVADMDDVSSSLGGNVLLETASLVVFVCLFVWDCAAHR